MSKTFQLTWDIETKDEEMAVMEFMTKILLKKESPQVVEQQSLDTQKTATQKLNKAKAVNKLKSEAEITIESVRSKLSEISQSGKSDAVKSLLMSHGAKSVKDLDPTDYEAVMVEAKSL